MANYGSRPAVLNYMEATLLFERDDPWPHHYCLSLLSDEVLPANQSFDAICRFDGKPPPDADIIAHKAPPRFYGIVTYRAPGGARWRRSFSFV